MSTSHLYPPILSGDGTIFNVNDYDEERCRKKYNTDLMVILNQHLTKLISILEESNHIQSNIKSNTTPTIKTTFEWINEKIHDHFSGLILILTGIICIIQIIIFVDYI